MHLLVYVSKSVLKCISHSFLADTYSKFFRIKIGFKPTIVDNELHSFEYIWFEISLWGAINSDCVGLGLQTGINKPQQARKPISINHLADNRTLSWLPTKCNNIKKRQKEQMKTIPSPWTWYSCWEFRLLPIAC